MSFDREQVRQQAAALAARGVRIGTSSWKYPGWRGQFYDESRYLTRGRFSEARFERDCLAEYAEVFKTVCVDAAYYTFPRPDYLSKLAAQVPPDFQFGFKVTDAITLRKFPNLPRFGPKAGQPNPDFLNGDLFASAFLQPCEAIRPQVGVLMFEFSKFYAADYQHGRDFVADLDRFLGALPTGWPYAVEMRNQHWLAPDYFQCLARHGVSHVFNNWSAMPTVGEQMALPGSRTNPALVAARFLLAPGRKYQEAVDRFSPYDRTQEANPEARAAGAKLITEGKAVGPAGKTLIFVNNRLEGSALNTIAAMLEQASLAP
jgi:uncharacterized protein YecE (DUF72 family)